MELNTEKSGIGKAEQQERIKKEKQREILRFVNDEAQQASDYEMEAFESLASVSGKNFTDDLTLHTELVTNTIPTYEKAVKEAKSIETGIEELEESKRLIIKATETFHEALLMEKEALEKNDEEMIRKSNKKMMEYQKLINDYHSEMKKLAEKYHIDYEPRKMNLEENIVLKGGQNEAIAAAGQIWRDKWNG
ncbi:hypothetical protein D1970_02840 [Mesobacillus zeae]|uniref:Uncharacterized protein n=1 Tax=Mesobacillus zeae TaxID=1917180 RepID=A0A398BGK3_9BACI|nr:hypothetical protein D1970_02840 [Mesobacillus zeae]